MSLFEQCEMLVYACLNMMHAKDAALLLCCCCRHDERKVSSGFQREVIDLLEQVRYESAQLLDREILFPA